MWKEMQIYLKWKWKINSLSQHLSHAVKMQPYFILSDAWSVVISIKEEQASFYHFWSCERENAEWLYYETLLTYFGPILKFAMSKKFQVIFCILPI